MALIKDVSSEAVFTDVRGMQLNSFAQVGSALYLCYTNMQLVGKVYRSDDAGITWTPAYSYEQTRNLAVTTSSDGSLITTRWDDNNIFVYKDGTQVTSGPNALGSSSVCFWPYLVLLSPGNQGSTVVDVSNGWRAISFATNTPAIYSVLGYGDTPASIDVIAASSFDISTGWGGRTAMRIGTGFTPYASWPGLESASLSGYLSFPDWSGVGTGGTHAVLADPSTVNLRGTFTPPHATRLDPVICDRGLSGPHLTAFACTVDDVITAFFVDRNTLLGSTVNTNYTSTADSAGDVSNFGQAKVYGNVTDKVGPYSYGAPTQTGALTTFFVSYIDVFNTTANNPLYPMTVHRFTDPTPLVRPHAANTQLLSQVTVVDRQTQSADPTETALRSRSLGVIRATPVTADYDLNVLRQGCTDKYTLVNPNSSPGCTPVLREFLTQSGLAYSLLREVARDGDPHSHQGGNAIDVAGPSTTSFTTGGSLSAAAATEIGTLVRLLRQVPQLFACVVHYDPTTPQRCLYVWDGKVVTVDTFGGAASPLVQASITNVHISSSMGRLLRGLSDPRTAAALGVSDTYTDDSGNVTAPVVVDPFSADRYVYVNDDAYYGNTTEGIAANESGHAVHWW